MTVPVEVVRPDDPAVADYVGLTDGARRMRAEPGAGFFIAEGDQVVRRAAAAGRPPRGAGAPPPRVAAQSPEIAAQPGPV